jgi:transforming growth factor-beta-induced protein
MGFIRNAPCVVNWTLKRNLEMLKKTLAIAGKLLVAPALLLIVSPGISSAQNQCPIQQAKMAAAQKTMKVSIAAPAEKDIVDTAVGAGSFNTLVAAVKAAGLVETLKGDGPFTVLAPTDEAFKKLPKGTVETLLKPENLKTLQAILTYHVIPGSVMAADVVKLKSAKTVQGDTVAIKVTDGGVMINGAKVVTTDIKCSNGVIHVIDSVIMPPEKADIVDTAVGAGSFNTLVAAVKAAGLVETLKGDGPFTVFAPTDDAFKKIPAATIAELLKPENKAKLASILTYHVVPGKVMAADVVKMSSAKTANGQKVKIKVVDGKVMINGATVIKADIDCKNGVVHVIDSVIMPK